MLADPPPRSGAGSRAGHIFKVDAKGNVPWAYTLTGADLGAQAYVESISVLSGSNKIVYSGRFVGHMDLGNGALTSSGGDAGYFSFFVVQRTP